MCVSAHVCVCACSRVCVYGISTCICQVLLFFRHTSPYILRLTEPGAHWLAMLAGQWASRICLPSPRPPASVGTAVPSFPQVFEFRTQVFLCLHSKNFTDWTMYPALRMELLTVPGCLSEKKNILDFRNCQKKDKYLNIQLGLPEVTLLLVSFPGMKNQTKTSNVTTRNIK